MVADALEEDEYCSISCLLERDIDLVEEWVYKRGVQGRTYWVCAVSVNQHAGICNANPKNDRDPADEEIHPVCECGFPKAWNNTPPLANGRSVNCEMNKFHLMMSFLAATDEDFEQVCAIDNDFVLFSRAWCISEIATANFEGIRQSLKIHSSWSLDKHSQRLMELKVENMDATRPEDKAEILAGIPDKDDFDANVQQLIFNQLIPAWQNFDDMEQMSRVGRLARWVHTGQTLGIYKKMMRISHFQKETAFRKGETPE
jgi:hypothetical protein